MIKLCGHQMSCIMLHQSHLMLDMTVEGKRLAQIMIYPYGNQTISPVANFFLMDGSLKAYYIYELYRLPYLLGNY